METTETKAITIAEKIIDIDPLSQFVPQITKGTEILSKCTVVSNLTELGNATTYLNKAKTLTGLIDKKVDELCRPLKDKKKEIDEVQRQIKEYAEKIALPIRDVAKAVEASIIAYNKKQREEAQLAAEKQREEMAAQILTNALGVSDAELLPVTPVIEPAKVKGLTTVWKYEIVDPFKVPREFCTPDAGLINAAVKSGAREIPGIKIYSEDQIRKS
jgi:hypothetical protein